MKYALTIAVWLMGLALFAQPVFENTYSESATICQLESLGEVYYSMDVVNKQCLIYSMDHSFIKSISLPTPEGYYLADIQYVSEHLFNSDDLLELVYIYSKYVPVELSYYYTFETRLINENGAVLLSLPGVGFTDVIETAHHGKKFLVYEYNYSVIPYRTLTHVYSLPEQATKSESPTFTGSIPGNAYPNPASRQITIPVQLPKGIPSGTLEVFDTNGQRLLSFPVSGSSANVVIPTTHFSPGTYIYHVQSGQWRSSSEKIVIKNGN
jgi:hypothetical protein